MIKIRFSFFLLLLAVLPSCEKEAALSAGAGEQIPLYFSVETKSLSGERTFRAAAFGFQSQAFACSGTYCSETVDHRATVPGGLWLAPCRVNDGGDPLRSDGTLAENLSQADKDSRYALIPNYGCTEGIYLVVSSPARKIFSGNGQWYYPWTSDAEFYVSDAVSATVSGCFLDGEYVYTSSAKEALRLRDRRARIYVHIECGGLSEAWLQSVSLLNCVNSARWSLLSGFSASDYTVETAGLYDCNDSPQHLVKARGDGWDSDREVFLPSIDYSDPGYVSLRPQIRILMGDDTDHPSQALVDITVPVEPMKDYTYNLYISKSNVTVTLAASAWDDGGTHGTVDDEAPAYIGTFDIAGWDDGGINDAADWNGSF